MNRTKSLFAVGMAAVLLSAGGFTGFAEESSSFENQVPLIIIAPKWESTGEVYPLLKVGSGKAICDVSITGKSGVTKISANIILEKKTGSSYTHVANWSVSSNSSYLLTTKQANVSSGTYRLRVVAKVYVGNNYETVSASQISSY